MSEEQTTNPAGVTLEAVEAVAEGIADTRMLETTFEIAHEHVGVVIAGGNVNLTEHAALTRTGLHELERYAEARLALERWPTAVGDVIETVESEGAALDVLEALAEREGVSVVERSLE